MILFLYALTPDQQQSVVEYVELYCKDLYNFAYRLTLNKTEAEDLFQQTWVKVVDKYDQYKIDNFKGWLYKICSNQFKDNYRKNARYKKLVKDDFSDSDTKDFVINTSRSEDSTYIKVELRDKKQMMLEKIYDLPEKQREPILMFYYQSMKYEDIADALSVPVGTVRSRINTAKKTLKIQMEGESYV
ncbi:MAG: RNA polymerase sigma factor [Clostridiales bacterium]|nr:RNA polymerase sigma factor [Clostridiales bacterium]